MSRYLRAFRASVILGIASAALYRLLSRRARARMGQQQPCTTQQQPTVTSQVVVHGSAKRKKLRERALLFGDSITQYSFGSKPTGEVGGWGALLSAEFARTLDVVNRGFSGYTTRGALTVADHVLGLAPIIGEQELRPTAGSTNPSARNLSADKEFLFVTIFFGANDSTDKILNPAQSVPVGEYKANLGRLVDKAQAVANLVVLISPPPVDSEAWARSRHVSHADRENARTELYCESARSVAVEKGALFVDTFHAMLRHDDWPSFLNDGLHLSSRGNQLVFELLTAVLREEAGVTDATLPLDFPLHGDVNGLEVDAAGHFIAQGVQSLPYKCRTYDD
jgi:lysophospholipase L1-like esterase